MDFPSGDQTIPRMLTSSCAMVDSVPSESQRTIKSLPFRAPCSSARLPRTNATRFPSEDGTNPLPRSGWLHAGLASPPAAGTFHNSASCTKQTLSPSSPQNASATPPSGNDVSAPGDPLPSAFAKYKFLTSARSHVNKICLLSGDQTGSDGCLISMSCSIVSAVLRLAVCALKLPIHPS